MVGTPVYMAPEQVIRDAVIQSDVFSLAAVLYEVLSLDHYLGDWDTGDFDDLLVRIVRSDRAPCPAFVPEALRAICDRGLSKDLAVRHGSACELADALYAWLARRRLQRRSIASALGLTVAAGVWVGASIVFG